MIKDNKKILLRLADFPLQVQPENGLMVAISRAWYNGSYTMAAKPIKTLELHYPMITFLIILVVSFLSVSFLPLNALKEVRFLHIKTFAVGGGRGTVNSGKQYQHLGLTAIK